MNQLCEFTEMSCDIPIEPDQILLQPFTYIQQIPGKNIRTKLSRAFNCWLNISDEKLEKINEILQMLHNSSLLIDDIEDNSILRRGIPVAHSIYGLASTINAANFVLILALERVMQLHHPEAVTVYIEQMLELHRGQGMEIYWRDNFKCPTEAEYNQMSIYKTGGLFTLGIRLMQLFSPHKMDFSKLTSMLGLYFQIRDDYCNLISKEYAEKKNVGEDLTEGKFSFPIIHAVRHSPQYGNQILNILKQRTNDVTVKMNCINLLEKSGSFQYTLDMLKYLDKEARNEINKLGENPLMMNLLNELLSWSPIKLQQDDTTG